MRAWIMILFISLSVPSCEKTPEYEKENGYFDGTLNGFKLNSNQLNNNYIPLVKFLKDYQCDLFGNGVLVFVFKTKGNELLDHLETGFYIDALKILEGKKYKKFNFVTHFSEKDCENIPIIRQFANRANDVYSYIPHKDNYLKINEVTEDHVLGCFEIKFFSKHFLETGIPSRDKQNFPDSIFIVCDKFVAPIRN